MNAAGALSCRRAGPRGGEVSGLRSGRRSPEARSGKNSAERLDGVDDVFDVHAELREHLGASSSKSTKTSLMSGRLAQLETERILGDAL